MSTIEIKQKTKTTTENFLNLLKDSQISFWVDSSGGPSCLCNNSFFGTNPKYYIYGSLNEVYEEQTGETAKWQYGENCFDFIEKKLEEEKHNKDGMFVGYFSYDLFQRSKENSYPDFFFAYFENTIPKSLKAYEPGMFLSLGVTPEGRGPEQGACDAALEGA